MAKIEIATTYSGWARIDVRAESASWHESVPKFFAAEIERLQRCADALEIAEKALKRIDATATWRNSMMGWNESTCVARDALTAIDAAKNPEAQR